MSQMIKKPGWILIVWLALGFFVARYLVTRAINNPGEAGLLDQVTGIIFNIVGVWVLLAGIAVIVGTKLLRKGKSIF